MSNLTECERCGLPGLTGGEGNPDARLLKRAVRGLCASCCAAQFLQTTDPIKGILQARGPQILLVEHVRRQFAQLMSSGNADARPEEINWAKVVQDWELPFPRAKGRKR